MASIKDALTAALYGEPEESSPVNLNGTEVAVNQDQAFTLTGEHVSIHMRSDLQDDSFLLTGMLRGIMGNLDWSRLSAIRLYENIETQAAQPGYNGQPRGLTEKQQPILDHLEQQLLNIADVSSDIKAFWSQVCDNPNLSVHPRTDAQVLSSIMVAEARKEEARQAKFTQEKATVDAFEARTSPAARQQSWLASANIPSHVHQRPLRAPAWRGLLYFSLAL